MQSWQKALTRLLLLACVGQLADTGRGLEASGTHIPWSTLVEQARQQSSGCGCVMRLNGGHMQSVKRRLIQEFQDTVQKAPEHRNRQEEEFEMTLCTPS